MFGKFRKKTTSTFFSKPLRVEVEIKGKINQFKPILIFDVCDDLFSNRVINGLPISHMIVTFIGVTLNRNHLKFNQNLVEGIRFHQVF